MNKTFDEQLLALGWELAYDGGDWKRYTHTGANEEEILVYRDSYQLYVNAWVTPELTAAIQTFNEEIRARAQEVDHA